MAVAYKKAWFGQGLIDFDQANVSVASAAVLYGLSVYTVFGVNQTLQGPAAFRLHDHFTRLQESARIIGLDTFQQEWTYTKFEKAVQNLIAENHLASDVLVRATVHASDILPGARSRGVGTELSMFIYDAAPILPLSGARLKTSIWRRVPDIAIPARAKVNGAYVNSVLGRQDALDSGYDDCLFLDASGHICELSTANVFMVRNGRLITPDTTSDLLEGINRRTIIELSKIHKIPVVERAIDLTELYVADEVFACGTSAFVAPIIEVDGRSIGNGQPGKLTTQLGVLHDELLHGKSKHSGQFLTYFLS